jgi:hypothetical protein
MKVAPIIRVKPESEDFTIAGVRPSMKGEDAAIARLQAIYGIASVMSMANIDARAHAGNSDFENINPELMAAAWDGVSLLAADAARALQDI